MSEVLLQICCGSGLVVLGAILGVLMMEMSISSIFSLPADIPAHKYLTKLVTKVSAENHLQSIYECREKYK